MPTLSSEQIALLESHHVFSVEDLIRATRNPARKSAVLKVIPEAVLDRALGCASVLVTPVVPTNVAEAMLAVGVESIDDFLGRDASRLAPLLAARLGDPISSEQVIRWQKELLQLKRAGISRTVRSDDRLHPIAAHEISETQSTSGQKSAPNGHRVSPTPFPITLLGLVATWMLVGKSLALHGPLLLSWRTSEDSLVQLQTVRKSGTRSRHDNIML